MPLPGTNAALQFNNVSYLHSGNYSCALKDNINTSSPQVILDVQYPPRNTSVSASPYGEILEGSSVTLTCSSNANPPVQTYTWFKNNRSVTSERGSGQSYSITNITSEDSGQYHCKVLNTHGAENSTVVTLNVAAKAKYYGPPVIIVVGTVLAALALILIIIIFAVRRKAGAHREEGCRGVGPKAAMDNIYASTAEFDL
ncbi:B-cell receptor CD22-like, partial [Megalops cyprinoides]|uniref:B-cell receptor CD22-like n=1 Tax=Megalops cyprinoides TaxID=118141 RepID=UPI001864F3CF